MNDTISRVVTLGMIAVGLSVGAAQAADVKIGINIGAPPPPSIVLSAPPPVVLVPNTRVYHVPSVADVNLFIFGGQYYSLHDGHWFHAKSHRGPWVVINAAAVPRPAIGVPVTYYKVPPGHAKKHKHGGKHEGAAADCPPGQAKKGRC